MPVPEDDDEDGNVNLAVYSAPCLGIMQSHVVGKRGLS